MASPSPEASRWSAGYMAHTGNSTVHIARTGCSHIPTAWTSSSMFAQPCWTSTIGTRPSSRSSLQKSCRELRRLPRIVSPHSLTLRDTRRWLRRPHAKGRDQPKDPPRDYPQSASWSWYLEWPLRIQGGVEGPPLVVAIRPGSLLVRNKADTGRGSVAARGSYGPPPARAQPSRDPEPWPDARRPTPSAWRSRAAASAR